jgi:MFS family permease
VPAFAAFAPGAAATSLIVLGAAVMYGTVGPSAAVLAEVVPSRMRATSISMLATAQNLLGLAVGPWLAGRLSDVFGFQAALATVPLASVLAAAAFAAAARCYRADRSSVTLERLDATAGGAVPPAPGARVVTDADGDRRPGRWGRAARRS